MERPSSVKFKILNATKYLGGGIFSIGCIITWIVFVEPYVAPNLISDPLAIWEIAILLAIFGFVLFFLSWVFSKLVSRYRFKYRDWRARRVAKVMGGMLILTLIIWIVPLVATSYIPGTSSGTDISISQLETQTFDLINKERINYGLSTVTWNDQIAQVARNHSKDMAQNNFFAHQNLQGKNVDDRLTEAGANFISCGEILFKQSIKESETTIWILIIPITSTDYKTQGELAQDAVSGWMASSGHRMIILTSEFSKAGVGISSNGDWYYFTGVFVG